MVQTLADTAKAGNSQVVGEVRPRSVPHGRAFRNGDLMERLSRPELRAVPNLYCFTFDGTVISRISTHAEEMVIMRECTFCCAPW